VPNVYVETQMTKRDEFIAAHGARLQMLLESGFLRRIRFAVKIRDELFGAFTH
jgi:hypothetical protein